MTQAPTIPPYDWRTVAVPPALANRPRDRRGFVIPASVEDGTTSPDFRVVKPENALRLTLGELCWLCGGQRDYWMTFIGGPISMSNRCFNDGWMHEACAEYALKVCPFLASPRGHYTTNPEIEPIHPLSVDYRPTRFGLGYTRSFRVDYSKKLLVAAPFRRIRWFDAWGHEITIACRCGQTFDADAQAIEHRASLGDEHFLEALQP
jgi:hypothetical protein